MSTFGFVSTLTDGPWGKIVCVVAVMYRNEKEIFDEFFAFTPIWEVANTSASKHIAMSLAGEQHTHNDEQSMLRSFGAWFNERNKHTTVWTGVDPIHLNFGAVLAALFRSQLINAADVPIDVVDLSTLFSTQKVANTLEHYVKETSLPVLTTITNVSHPIRQCVVGAAVFFHMTAKRSTIDLTTPTRAAIVTDTHVPASNGETQAREEATEYRQDTTPQEQRQNIEAGATESTTYDEDEDVDDKKNGVPVPRATVKRRRKQAK